MVFVIELMVVSLNQDGQDWALRKKIRGSVLNILSRDVSKSFKWRTEISSYDGAWNSENRSLLKTKSELMAERC